MNAVAEKLEEVAGEDDRRAAGGGARASQKMRERDLHDGQTSQPVQRTKMPAIAGHFIAGESG